MGDLLEQVIPVAIHPTQRLLLVGPVCLFGLAIELSEGAYVAERRLLQDLIALAAMLERGEMSERDFEVVLGELYPEHTVCRYAAARGSDAPRDDLLSRFRLRCCSMGSRTHRLVDGE